ncbi:formin-like protein 14 [Leopardus geoffroyi]|uniref:formin-like protein 14 n=1 Tax=Leopardus geoffroyi TaxID=46844 RepID=UPI001E26475E|nr:formin-like protein 14 [Leopardus geoffroyi]XP_045331306.1 formin-like protein 14 [Leopardus geoffroyi]XP_045331307.1 formin-like protein 14 [Leopardus geoffroyi]XP_045331308.1 formin-like protein 14 [Leopardus geoffroyi]
MEWGRGRPRWPQPRGGHFPPWSLFPALCNMGVTRSYCLLFPQPLLCPCLSRLPLSQAGAPPSKPCYSQLGLTQACSVLRLPSTPAPPPWARHPRGTNVFAAQRPWGLLPIPPRPSLTGGSNDQSSCPALSHVPTLEQTLFKRVSFLPTSSPPTPCCPPQPRTQHPHGQVSQPVVFSAPPRPPPRPRGASSAPLRAALACPLPRPHPAGHPRSWWVPDVLLAEALNGAVTVDVHGLRGRQRETRLLMCCWLCAHPALGCGKPPPASSGGGRTEGGAGTGVPSCGGALQLKTALPQLPQANPGRTGTRRS